MVGLPGPSEKNSNSELDRLRVMLAGLHEEFSEVFDRCARAGFASIDATIQQHARRSAKDLGAKLVSAKNEAVAVGDERAANSLLSGIFTLRALHGELSMWLALKNGRPERAWERLIEAQALIKGALRADRHALNLGSYLDRLHALEEFLFPPQLFFSVGMVVTSIKCSICGGEYGECPHVAGRPYMGSLCCEVITEVSSLPEISVVDEPMDKGCRARYRERGGVKIDVLTGLPHPEEDEEGMRDRAEPGFTRVGGYAVRFGDDREAFPEE